MQVQPLGWEDPLKECMATHSNILAWSITMDRGAWRAAVHGVTKESDTTEQLSMHTHCTDTVIEYLYFEPRMS